VEKKTVKMLQGVDQNSKTYRNKAGNDSIKQFSIQPHPM